MKPQTPSTQSSDRHHPPLPADVESRRFLRLSEVRDAVGLSTATIYKYIEAGRFPAGVLLSPRCRRWPAREIVEWLDARAE